MTDSSILLINNDSKHQNILYTVQKNLFFSKRQVYLKWLLSFTGLLSIQQIKSYDENGVIQKSA